MSLTLKVRYFQSIERVDLEIDGFTVITGRTNLGKSALVRAMSGAFFGIPGDAYIQRGAKQAQVQLKGEDFELTWTKVGKETPQNKTRLKINGTTHTKLGRDHAQLTQPLRVEEIQTTAARVKPQFANQHDAMFLLTLSPAAVAEVFKTLGRADVVTKAQGFCRKDRTAATAQKDVREQDLEQRRKERDRYHWVPEAETRLAILKTTEQVRQDNRDQLAEMDRLEEVKKRPSAPLIPVIRTLRTIKWIEEWEALAPSSLPGAEPTLKQAYAEILGHLDWLRIEGGDRSGTRRRLEEELQGIQLEKRQLETELEVCPTCGQAFHGCPGSD